MDSTQSSMSPFAFLRVIEALKNIPREGWVIRGVESPESICDHMYRMAVMIWMLPGVRLMLPIKYWPAIITYY